MYLAHEFYPLTAIAGDMLGQDRKRLEPHCKVMEILAVAVGLLADAEAARAPAFLPSSL